MIPPEGGREETSRESSTLHFPFHVRSRVLRGLTRPFNVFSHARDRVAARNRAEHPDQHQCRKNLLDHFASPALKYVSSDLRRAASRRCPARSLCNPRSDRVRTRPTGRQKGPACAGPCSCRSTVPFNYFAIRVPTTSMSTRRSGCRHAMIFALVPPTHSPAFVTGCDSPLPSVCMRFAAMPLLTR